MSSFDDLIQQVQEKNLCHRCGGCVSFCTAINYGALEVNEGGNPGYKDTDKCLQCGLCYMLCPEIDELTNETRNFTDWKSPMGNIISTDIMRAEDIHIRQRATDGGVVTAILIHLLQTGRIDTAIVSKQSGLFNREPYLATTKEELLLSCGSFFDTSHGMVLFSEHYSTFIPSIQALDNVKRMNARKIAFVGTPCQVNAMRRMQALGVVPSDTVHCVMGLFCSGNFSFDDKARKRLEQIGEFKWSEARKINIKDKLYVHLKNDSVHALPLEEMDSIIRPACRYCEDYTAEYADLSFGGIGAEAGWTTILTRTPLGLDILRNAEKVLERKPVLQLKQDKEKEKLKILNRRIRHLKYTRKFAGHPHEVDALINELSKEHEELQNRYTDSDLNEKKHETVTLSASPLDQIMEKDRGKKKKAAQNKNNELGVSAYAQEINQASY